MPNPRSGRKSQFIARRYWYGQRTSAAKGNGQRQTANGNGNGNTRENDHADSADWSEPASTIVALVRRRSVWFLE